MSPHEVVKIIGAAVIGLIAVLVIQHYSHNYSQVEMAWTIAGVIGLIFASANFYDAAQDKLALQKLPLSEKTAALTAIARAGERTEALRSIKMCIVIALGVISGIEPPAISDEDREKLGIPLWTTPVKIITAGLLMIVAIIVLQIILDRRLRKAFYGRPREMKGVIK